MCMWMAALTTGVSQTGLSRAGRCGPYVQWASSKAYPQRWPSATPYTPALLSIESEHPGKTGCSPLCGPSLGLKREEEENRLSEGFQHLNRIFTGCFISGWGIPDIRFDLSKLICVCLYFFSLNIKIFLYNRTYNENATAFYLAAQWWSPSAAWVWGRSWCGRAGSGTYGRSGAQQTPPGRPPTTGQTGWCSVPSPSHNFPLTVACETPQRDH